MSEQPGNLANGQQAVIGIGWLPPLVERCLASGCRAQRLPGVWGCPPDLKDGRPRAGRRRRPSDVAEEAKA